MFPFQVSIQKLGKKQTKNSVRAIDLLPKQPFNQQNTPAAVLGHLLRY